MADNDTTQAAPAATPEPQATVVPPAVAPAAVNQEVVPSCADRAATVIGRVVLWILAGLGALLALILVWMVLSWAWFHIVVPFALWTSRPVATAPAPARCDNTPTVNVEVNVEQSQAQSQGQKQKQKQGCGGKKPSSSSKKSSSSSTKKTTKKSTKKKSTTTSENCSNGGQATGNTQDQVGTGANASTQLGEENLPPQ